MKNKKITVTGGKGFLGNHLIRKLQTHGCRNVSIADLPEYNLVNFPDIQRMYDDLKPDIVIHLAAKVGGIGFNQENPASLFYENAMMGIQLIHEGYLKGIEKFVALGTICAYPKFASVPFREDDIWNGYPEETNAPYGLAKKMMLVQSHAYRQQYGFNSIFLLPVNLYGPGDNFSFKSSHVIPALIRKFYLADLLAQGDYDSIVNDFLRNNDNEVKIGNLKLVIGKDSSYEDILKILEHYGIYHSRIMNHAPEYFTDDSQLKAQSSKLKINDIVVEIWGTGEATREFFYVEDAAEAIILAAEQYDRSDPVNIGAGFEISIKELTGLIIEIIGFQGDIAWNTSKPDGQPRRMLSTERAEQEFGFKAQTQFKHGLKKTIDWYIPQL